MVRPFVRRPGRIWDRASTEEADAEVEPIAKEAGAQEGQGLQGLLSDEGDQTDIAEVS